MDHYEHYYRVKSEWAKQDPIAMLSSPTWLSSLEDAFLWIGGRRPSTAFHLLFSKSGLQLEKHLKGTAAALLHQATGDLGDLTPEKMVRMDDLQRRTISEEKSVSEKMAKLQETIADLPWSRSLTSSLGRSLPAPVMDLI